VLAADSGFAPEVPALENLMEEVGGSIMRVPFFEGEKPRQSGTFSLGIVQIG